MDIPASGCEQTLELMTLAYTARLLHENLSGSVGGSISGITNRVVMAFLDTLSSRLPEIVEALEKPTENLIIGRLAA